MPSRWSKISFVRPYRLVGATCGRHPMTRTHGVVDALLQQSSVSTSTTLWSVLESRETTGSGLWNSLR